MPAHLFTCHCDWGLQMWLLKETGHTLNFHWNSTDNNCNGRQQFQKKNKGGYWNSVSGLTQSQLRPWARTSGSGALACSRRSNSGARAKNIASEGAGKNEGRLGKKVHEGNPLALFPSLPSPSFPVSLLVFPALLLAIIFVRAPLSERLEQASFSKVPITFWAWKAILWVQASP